MADTTPAAPAAPVAAPTAVAPQPGATVTPIKTHHSAAQPREEGRFAGPPGTVPEPPAATTARRTWKVGAAEYDNPDEVAAIAAERVVDHEHYQQLQQAYAEAQQALQRNKDPLATLTAEQRRAIARAELEAFQREEEERKLPPEVQRILSEKRRLEAENQKFLTEREQYQRQQQHHADTQMREGMVADVRATLQHLGADESPSITTREVLAEMRANIKAGKRYPPEVVARRVRQRLEGESLSHVVRLAKSNPSALLANEELVTALNGIKDPALLQKLAGLIDTGRRLNMDRMSATPVGQPPPTQGGPPPVSAPVGREPRTEPEWQAWFQAGNKPTLPTHYQAMQRLKSKGLM